MQEMQDAILLKLNLSQSTASFESNLTSVEPPPTLSLPTAVTAGRSFVHLLAAAVGMLTLTLTATIANILVMVIFFKHRRLRRCKNVYLVGLSVADLGVGLCMPLGMADEMLSRWAPGGVPCRLYLVVRDSLLFISLLTVLQVTSLCSPVSVPVSVCLCVCVGGMVVVWCGMCVHVSVFTRTDPVDFGFEFRK